MSDQFIHFNNKVSNVVRFKVRFRFSLQKNVKLAESQRVKKKYRYRDTKDT